MFWPCADSIDMTDIKDSTVETEKSEVKNYLWRPDVATYNSVSNTASLLGTSVNSFVTLAAAAYVESPEVKEAAAQRMKAIQKLSGEEDSK